MKFKNLIKTLILPILLSSCSFSIPEKEMLDFYTLRTNLGFRDLPSKGSPSILVIPVVFTDCSLNEEELSYYHNKIDDTFFGESEDTYWESVSSFYNKSSYGALSLKGKVSPYFYYPTSIVEANSIYESKRKEPTYDVLKNAVEWYQNNNSDIKNYDTNNDGIIDSVWLIYMEKYNHNYFKEYPTHSSYTNLNEFLWAYTYWYTERWEKNYVRPFAYAWASYQFLDEGTSTSTDAHTFIHETGHLLGLEDYYNYDYLDKPILGDRSQPTGALDMMDNNILDHNAYTKYLLDWIKPVEINEDGEYSISSFQETGDAYIIRATDNDSPLDEYLIIEYYTPTGLNEHDTNNKYSNSPNGFSESGIKIYHVDSRIGLFSYRNHALSFDRYIDNHEEYFSNNKKGLFNIANSNTPSRSGVKDNRLISLISSEGKSRLYFVGSRNKVYAENKDLFQENETLNSFEFHSYVDQDLKIEIIDSSSSSCTFKVTGVGK